MTDATTHKPARAMQAPHAARRARGFSLIEVLIAILIFSFGVLGLVGLQAKAIQYSAAAENTNRAALLANEASSAMWNKGSVTLDPAVVSAWQAKVADPVQGLPGGQGEIEVQGGVAEIRLRWTAPSSAATHQYTTQVAIAF